MLAATKQRYDLFVKCFAAGMFQNAAQAAVDAKFAVGSARQTASRLLTIDYVKVGIAKAKAVLAVKLDITAERVVAEFAKIGFVNVEDFTDEDGNLKKISEIGRENMAAVSSIEVTKDKGKRTVKFRLHSKTKALDSLGKHLGIFAIDNLQRGSSLADIAAIFAAAGAKHIESEVVG